MELNMFAIADVLASVGNLFAHAFFVVPVLLHPQRCWRYMYSLYTVAGVPAAAVPAVAFVLSVASILTVAKKPLLLLLRMQCPC